MAPSGWSAPFHRPILANPEPTSSNGIWFFPCVSLSRLSLPLAPLGLPAVPPALANQGIPPIRVKVDLKAPSQPPFHIPAKDRFINSTFTANEQREYEMSKS